MAIIAFGIVYFHAYPAAGAAMTTRHMVAMGALAAGLTFLLVNGQRVGSVSGIHSRRDADANAIRELRHTRRS